MLCKFSSENNFPSIYSICNTEYMDDGTPLCLNLTINRDLKQAIFDFTGTGP
jgi:5-oxoprolinase (ATP-hydrolysing)